MTPPVFLRLCGAGCIVAGILFAVWGYIDRPYIPVHLRTVEDVLSCVVPTLFLVGLVGLCGLCGTHIRAIGWMGLLFAFCGSTWGVAGGIVDVTPLYAYFAQRGWPPCLIDWLALMFTGLILVGIATVGTRTSTYLGALSLAIGAFGWVYYVTDSSSVLGVHVIHGGFGLLFSLGWGALGFALWSAGTNRRISYVRQPSENSPFRSPR
jgi:hypothetical protein